MKTSDNSKLWVDDTRPAPDNSWDHATTFHEAICMLERNLYTEVSLAHDLGCYYGFKEMTGFDIVCWIEGKHSSGFEMPVNITSHSANPIGKGKILIVAQRIKAHEEKMRAMARCE